jgi:hypothetical protein
MGEIADDFVNGACCALCGVYFQGEHGYPVLCRKCWTDRGGRLDGTGPTIIDGYQLAFEPEI